jgi:ABC-type multidrug transport system ATPase subunit
MRCDLLVLDEVLSLLDAEGVARAAALLRRALGEGRLGTVLVVAQVSETGQ